MKKQTWNEKTSIRLPRRLCVSDENGQYRAIPDIDIIFDLHESGAIISPDPEPDHEIGPLHQVGAITRAELAIVSLYTELGSEYRAADFFEWSTGWWAGANDLDNKTRVRDNFDKLPGILRRLGKWLLRRTERPPKIAPTMTEGPHRRPTPFRPFVKPPAGVVFPTQIVLIDIPREVNDPKISATPWHEQAGGYWGTLHTSVKEWLGMRNPLYRRIDHSICC